VAFCQMKVGRRVLSFSLSNGATIPGLVIFKVEPSAFAAALCSLAVGDVGDAGVVLQDTPRPAIAAKATMDAYFIDFSSPFGFLRHTFTRSRLGDSV
jgi:hypothetical protein